jgi:hypothetical protein
MTDPSDRPAAPRPRPASDINQPFRGQRLEGYLWSNRDKFTEAALAHAAEAAGYGPEEVAAAAQAVARRRADEAAAKPVKARARRIVLAGYGITWLIFAFLFLRPDAPDIPSYYGTRPVALGILAFVMLIAVGLGLAWVATRRPPAAQAERALAIMLAVPFVLLVLVAGSCIVVSRPLIFPSPV